MRRPEHLEVDHVLAAGVLDVVRQGLRHVADVARPEADRARVRVVLEQRHAGLAGDVILPFGDVGMPVQLPHRSRLDHHIGHRDLLGEREDGRVDHPHTAGGVLLCRLHVEHREGHAELRGGVALGHRGEVVGQRRRNRGREDVAALGRDGVERLEGVLGHSEVLGHHLARRVDQPVAEERRVLLVERALVEDEQELASVRPEALDGMRQALRKIPKVARLDVGNERLALVVEGRDPGGPVEHEGPFVGGVPVQLANSAGNQAHVHGRDLLGDRKIGDVDLPGPAAFLHAAVGLREALPELLHGSVVGRRRCEGIGLKPLQRLVLRTRVRSAPVGLTGLDGRLRLRLRGGGQETRAESRPAAHHQAPGQGHACHVSRRLRIGFGSVLGHAISFNSSDWHVRGLEQAMHGLRRLQHAKRCRGKQRALNQQPIAGVVLTSRQRR